MGNTNLDVHMSTAGYRGSTQTPSFPSVLWESAMFTPCILMDSQDSFLCRVPVYRCLHFYGLRRQHFMKMHATLQCGRREYMSHPLCGAFCVEARVISETIFVGITLSLPFACVCTVLVWVYLRLSPLFCCCYCGCCVSINMVCPLSICNCAVRLLYSVNLDSAPMC